MRKTLYILSITITCLIVFNKKSIGQEKKQIHFLADTINAHSENSILEIGQREMELITCSIVNVYLLTVRVII